MAAVLFRLGDRWTSGAWSARPPSAPSRRGRPTRNLRLPIDPPLRRWMSVVLRPPMGMGRARRLGTRLSSSPPCLPRSFSTCHLSSRPHLPLPPLSDLPLLPPRPLRGRLIRNLRLPIDPPLRRWMPVVLRLPMGMELARRLGTRLTPPLLRRLPCPCSQRRLSCRRLLLSLSSAQAHSTPLPGVPNPQPTSPHRPTFETLDVCGLAPPVGWDGSVLGLRREGCGRRI